MKSLKDFLKERSFIHFGTIIGADFDITPGYYVKEDGGYWYDIYKDEVWMIGKGDDMWPLTHEEFNGMKFVSPFRK